MKLSTIISAFLALGLAVVPSVLGWGQEGHEIVATIADMHLTPQAKAAVCDILRDKEGDACHLAPHAMWADDYKKLAEGRWSANTHFINPKDDDPPNNCPFGETGWTDSKYNIVDAVINQTHRLTDGGPTRNGGDTRLQPLLFLIHLIGDMHQPLHLSGRDRGGTRYNAIFDGRTDDLHAIWDTALVRRAMQDAESLDWPELEPELEVTVTKGSYTALVRYIEQEGIRKLWRDETGGWTACTGSVPASSQHLGQLPLMASTLDASLLACPLEWARTTSALNCEYVWTQDMDSSPGAPHIELDGEYWSKLEQDKVIPKLLAQGGLRLAAVLNAALG